MPGKVVPNIFVRTLSNSKSPRPIKIGAVKLLFGKKTAPLPAGIDGDVANIGKCWPQVNMAAHDFAVPFEILNVRRDKNHGNMDVFLEQRMPMAEPAVFAKRISVISCDDKEGRFGKVPPLKLRAQRSNELV